MTVCMFDDSTKPAAPDCVLNEPVTQTKAEAWVLEMEWVVFHPYEKAIIPEYIWIGKSDVL